MVIVIGDGEFSSHYNSKHLGTKLLRSEYANAVFLRNGERFLNRLTLQDEGGRLRAFRYFGAGAIGVYFVGCISRSARSLLGVGAWSYT